MDCDCQWDQKKTLDWCYKNALQAHANLVKEHPDLRVADAHISFGKRLGSAIYGDMPVKIQVNGDNKMIQLRNENNRLRKKVGKLKHALSFRREAPNEN